MDKYLLLAIGDNTSLKEFLEKSLENTEYRLKEVSPFENILDEIKLSKNIYSYSNLHKYIGIIVYLKEGELDKINQIKAINPSIPIIVISNVDSKDFLVELLRYKIFCFYNESIIETEFVETIKLASEFYQIKDKLEIISSESHWIELVIPSELIYINRIDSFFRHNIKKFPEKERNKIIFAFRELIQNAVEHGSNFCADKKIVIKYLRSEKFISFSVKDQGEGFKFESVPHATIGGKNSPAEVIKYRKKIGMRPGGLGISSVLNIADELIYNTKGNEVMMVKYFKE